MNTGVRSCSMWEKLVIAASIFLQNPLPPVMAQGRMTTFWTFDGHNNDRLGCVRAARELLGDNRLRDELPIVATRDEPACGTPVMVENLRTGRAAMAVKRETGSWGCRFPDGSRAVLGPRHCERQGGKRLTVADASLGLTRLVGSDGSDPVRLRWHGKPDLAFARAILAQSARHSSATGPSLNENWADALPDARGHIGRYNGQ